jgi:formate C-acetyltransferase
MLVHSKTPDDLLIKAAQANSLGGGWPMFLNQDLMVENLLSRASLCGPPLSIADARKRSGAVGCHEATIAGMESGWGAGFAKSERGSGYSGGGLPGLLLFLLKSGTEFNSFEELKKAISERIGGQANSIATNLAEAAGLRPSVLASALVEDCIENGIAKEKGGARYNIGVGGGVLFASPDFANSMAAIRKLIFDEKRITMAQLLHALNSNFEGHEDIRKMCLEAPKFGNDDDYVDELLVWITHLSCQEGKKQKTLYGGRRYPSLIPLAYSVSAGRELGALPSGRLAGEPLSDGVSPTQGSDVDSPTAVFKSVGKINNAEVGLGQALNVKLDPALFGSEEGFKRMADLVRVFVDQKVDHVQFNIVSIDTLRAAQREPDKYEDLTVKVAGYNARFVRLYKELQDSIIERTEHGA